MMQVRIQGLTKTFGDLTAVDSLDLTLGDGEIWGFIGPNGAGKTTTLRMLATVEQPTDGDAWLGEHSVVRHAEKVRPLIGFMPDYYGSYPDLLVSEYLDFFARSYGFYGRERRRQIDEVVNFTEITPLLDKRVTELSKGMRQRISLGRTLLHDPQFLLLDEPAAGLDPQARRDLRELLKLLADARKTVLISSHILAELEGLVDKVAIIQKGRLVYQGDPSGRREDGEEMTVNMRVLGDLQASLRCALETPGVINARALDPDIIEVRMDGGPDEIGTLVRRLVEVDQTPYSVVTEEKLLEDVFLEMTGGGPSAEKH